MASFIAHVNPRAISIPKYNCEGQADFSDYQMIVRLVSQWDRLMTSLTTQSHGTFMRLANS